MTTVDWRKRFDDFVAWKTQRAETAHIPGYTTVKDYSPQFNRQLIFSPQADFDLIRLFDGFFYRSTHSRTAETPLSNAVFVQSADGNTDTESGNPADLEGGATDLHLVYEGLSRAAVDGVVAGARTVRDPGPRGLILSVWHPAVVDLRRQLAPTRHPAQIVITASGDLDFDHPRMLMFNVPEIPVYILTTDAGAEKLERAVKPRAAFIQLISTGVALEVGAGLRRLHTEGLRYLSVIGGRTTVSTLFDQNLVSDLYLTTAARPGGIPHTPFYVGVKGLPSLQLVVEKKGKEEETGVVFQHFIVG